jgi:hypothetical protein
MRIREIDPASGTFEEKAMRGAMGETPLRVIRRRLSAPIGAVGAGTRLAVTLIFFITTGTAQQEAPRHPAVQFRPAVTLSVVHHRWPLLTDRDRVRGSKRDVLDQFVGKNAQQPNPDSRIGARTNQSADLNRLIVNSISPPGSSRQDSTADM